MSDLLPTDIIVRILLNLPVESLLRCTAVCRSWHSIITGPSFIAAQHLHRAYDCQTVLLRHYSVAPPKKEHISLHSDPGIADSSFKLIKSPVKPRKNMYTRLVGTLHGLVCMSDDIFGYTYRIVLWNPSIWKHIELPRPSVTYDKIGSYMFVLGFGYDRSTNDYKVVRVAYAQGSGASDVLPPLAEVYAVKEKAWRRVTAVGVGMYILEASWTQCFLHGRVHWSAYEKNKSRVANSILLFDMVDEKFRKMKLPKSLIDVNPIRLSVSDIGGFLTILHCYYVGAELKRHCDIWVRKDYDDVKSWSKMYTVNVLGASGFVLGLRGEDEILLVKDSVEFPNPAELSSYSMSSGELISYNPKTHETQNFGAKGIVDSFCYMSYLESLVFLEKDSGASSDGKKMKRYEKRPVTRGQAESNADQVSEEEETSGSDTDEESKGPSDFELKWRKFICLGFQMMRLGAED